MQKRMDNSIQGLVEGLVQVMKAKLF